jgi:hypothetical protein
VSLVVCVLCRCCGALPDLCVHHHELPPQHERPQLGGKFTLLLSCLLINE